MIDGGPGQRVGMGDAPAKVVRLGLAARLRAYFFAGVLVTAPLAITVYLAWLLISFFDSRVIPLLPARFNPETYLPFAVPGLGLVVAVLTLMLIGAFAAGYLGRLLTRGINFTASRMPVLRSVYGAVKQIVETVLAQESAAFREAELVEYPRRGIWTIAFITGVASGEVQALTEDEVLNVFVPTTPNPTSGFLLFVPRKDVRPLAMSVESALKLIISGGLVAPHHPASDADAALPAAATAANPEPSPPPATARPDGAGAPKPPRSPAERA